MEKDAPIAEKGSSHSSLDEKGEAGLADIVSAFVLASHRLFLN
jgi:hypothetical protein